MTISVGGAFGWGSEIPAGFIEPRNGTLQNLVDL
jgi:hypothetical protein